MNKKKTGGSLVTAKPDRAVLLNCYNSAEKKHSRLVFPRQPIEQPSIGKTRAIELLVSLSEPDELQKLFVGRYPAPHEDRAILLAWYLREIAKQIATGWTKTSRRSARELYIIARAAKAVRNRKLDLKITMATTKAAEWACEQLGKSYEATTIEDWISAEVKRQRRVQKSFLDSIPSAKKPEK